MLYIGICIFCLVTGTIYVDAGSPRIVIVGAGASGIAAASKLLQNGFEDVLILEAEDRIGGRVHTVKFGNAATLSMSRLVYSSDRAQEELHSWDEYSVDLGAQWIHGEEGNVAYQLAAPLNITDHSDPVYDEKFTSSGELIDPEIMKNVSDFYFQLMESKDSLKNCNGSLGECYEIKLKEYFALFPELNETMQQQLLWQFDQIQMSFDAADTWYDLSPDQDGYMTCPGDNGINWKERGYGTILDILMKKFPNPDEELPVLNKTILKAEVTKVDYSSQDGVVKITTLDNKEYVADHVIMTPSLGVLKAQYETIFTPQLPESKIKNIKGLGFGNAAKIILAFNETWYNYRGMKSRVYSLLWNETERKELDANLKTKWLPHVLGITIVEHKPRLLLLWVSGRGARFMDDLTDDEVLDQTIGILENFLGKKYNVTRPIAMIRSKWHQNKHFRGTYSYRSMETQRTNTSAKQLAEPIIKMGKPVILFAGEATNEHHFSTVHGAIASGWREADRLMNLYSKNIKK